MIAEERKTNIKMIKTNNQLIGCEKIWLMLEEYFHSMETISQ